MATTQELAQRLETPEGWLPMCSGWLRNWKAKKAHASYTEGEVRGVAENITLRELQYEGNEAYYRVSVFSTRGPVAPQIVEQLTRRVAQVAVNMIRYEACGDGGFYGVLYEDGTRPQDDYVIHRLSDEYEDVFILVQAGFSPEEIDNPYVAFSRHNGSLSVYFISRKHL